jgi:hypothetical protein
MPLGTTEGYDRPQALEYIKAEGRHRQVELADVLQDLAAIEEEADSHEVSRILGLFRDQLEGLGESPAMRAVALRIDDAIAARGDHAVIDVAELVATRWLKYVRGPSQEREREHVPEA